MSAPARFGPVLATVVLLTTGAASRAQENSLGGQEEEVLGGSAAFDLEQQAKETVWVQQGMPLFSRPDTESQRLVVVDALSELEVLERSGDWRKVHYDARIGWIRPDLPWKDRVVAIHTDVDPLAVATPGVDAESLRHLELVRQLLGAPRGSRELGPYVLLTDVRDDNLLAAMGDVAAQLDSYYEERYQLTPGGPEGQTVAVFAAEETYRRFEDGTTELPRKNRQGHTIGGLASLFVGDQRDAEVRSLLVHEVTHLINRRALGPRPPAWVEEGIANDLAFCQADRDGRLRARTLDGSNTVLALPQGRQNVMSGGLASLSQLLKARNRRQGTPLASLVEMSREQFMAPERRGHHYVASAFLIRLLLDGPRPKWTDGFREYLAEVAAGRHPDADALSALLGSSWPEIETGLDAWLRMRSVQLLR